MKQFTKPSLTLDEQIVLLEKRGLIISDRKEALFYLSHLNYYRLRAYWMLFEEDSVNHHFKQNTQFEDIVKLYIFDRELRLLMLDALERIEVSVRSQWAYQLSVYGGAHAHIDPIYAKRRDLWQSDIERLKIEVDRAKDREAFIKHFSETYEEELPPIWAICEIMSLGSLSRWFQNLKPNPVRKKIAKTFKVHESVLESWLHHLTVIRNISAHHGRLWNRRFTVIPAKPESYPKILVNEFNSSRKIYNSLLLLIHLMDCVSPQHHWKAKLKDLVKQSPNYLDRMGFPQNWESRDIWA